MKRKYKLGGHESDPETTSTNPNGWYNKSPVDIGISPWKA